jgi:cytochrome c
MGANHPIIWYHEFDGGRAFYTGLGHTNESYSEPLFLRHLLEGIRYAVGSNAPLDYGKAYSVRAPEDNRFTKTVLSNDLNEPMELAVAADGRVFFTERAGNCYMYDPKIKKTKLLRRFPAKAVDKYLNGLIGITLDPDFNTNKYIYFFYSSSTGEMYHQNVSRFKITDDGNLDTLSEQVIIKIPIDLEVSAHTGGSLAWDKYKNLYISTGDNTVPFESNGYAPLDERPGRLVYDAQRSAANANDLRGKILRITPQPDGTYTIPAGNLFPPGTAGTKPEIYVMGCRNPYRIAVDTATSILYWGEVGPDAGRDAAHAPRGYDEFNQAKQAGNFGWPYFIGDSKPYHDSDFAAQTVGPMFDINGPENRSPNNKGIARLPPPNKPMIWYPYNRSEQFPDLGEGGRCAMGGPIYHYNPSLTNPARLPAHYDKGWFIYDWMRNWVFVVRMDEQNNYKRLERFMTTNGDFRRPVDMEFAPDGTLYMLEYGSIYGIDNEDARLVRIDFNPGNRAPVAQVTARDTIGLAPFRVTFSSARSYDYDEEDKLTYQWKFGDNGETSTLPNPVYTYKNNGIYNAILTITDPKGERSTDTLEIKVGNTLPQLAVSTKNNSTFFFNKPTSLQYQVDVKDNEDPVIDKKKLKVRMNFLPKVAGNEVLTGHQQIENYNYGKNLIATSDCKACHQVTAKSVGPSFAAVAAKYKNDKNAVGYLVNKVIAGGSGVWGEHFMSAHPQLSKEDATEMVKYVLSVSDEKKEQPLAGTGTLVLSEHLQNPDEGRYVLSASYTDKGGAITPLTNHTTFLLRPAKVQATEFDVLSNIQRQGRRITNINNGSWFMLRNIDLNEVDSITYNYAAAGTNGVIELHVDSLRGPVVSTATFTSTNAWNRSQDIKAAVTPVSGRHNLFFVFRKDEEPNKNIAAVNWIRFEGGKEVKLKAAPKSKVAADTRQPAVNTAVAKTASSAAKTSAGVTAGKALYTKSDCNACHRPNTKLVGPSLVSIAQKYAGKAGVQSKLADKVIKGGAGVWGQIPMTPHPQLSKKDATQMVEYILSLKK